VNLIRTVDGGRTLQSVKGPHHGDHHDVWINPADPKLVIAGNDGGHGRQQRRRRHWVPAATPTPQFYNIDVDDRVPYHVGGTMQDWGTSSGPAYTLRPGGPNIGDFRYVGGGEAGDFVYDPAEPGVIYAGRVLRLHLALQGRHGQLPQHQRLSRATSPARAPRTRSTASSGPRRSRSRRTIPRCCTTARTCCFAPPTAARPGRAISPDLTRNDKSKQKWSGGPITGDNTGVEVYDVIFSVAESPAAAGQIWVGTDDGLVQLTRDGGKSWQNVTPTGMPQWGTVEAVEPSRKDAGTAYVVVDARRLNDARPYLFRTRDYGKSWERLSKGLPDDEHLFVLREDTADPNLLFVGSERGLYYSRDGGSSFQNFRINLPAVNVADIEVKHDDLILGTRRGIWILDDLSTVRQFTPKVKLEAVHLFASRPAYRFRTDARWDQDHDGPGRERAHRACS
jgi:hypothetical protein